MSTENAIALIQEGGKVWTTSLAVAEKFGKRHDSVLRTIRELECSGEFRLRNFVESIYVNDQGRQQPCIRMTRDGFTFLAMGFTGKEAAYWKERFIEAFNALEHQAIALLEEDRAHRRRLEERQQALAEQLAGNIALWSGAVQDVKFEVVELKQGYTIHSELIQGLTADVIDLKARRNSRKEISEATKARHREVFLLRGSSCPCCFKQVTATQCDHFYDNQRADFEHTWPLCIECHSKLTNGKLSRLEVKRRFEAYQEFAVERLPKQKPLF